MLNSTLHLNVFGWVNTALIDKDSQCIYQLSRLSTLSHWSLPRSMKGEAGAGKGEKEDSCYKNKKSCCTPHLYSVVYSQRSFSMCPLGFLLYSHPGLGREMLDNTESIQLLLQKISLHPHSFLWQWWGAMACQSPSFPHAHTHKKRSWFISIWMAGARARVCRSRPTGHGWKTLWRMRVGGLLSCFNGLHAVYTGLILKQYHPPTPNLQSPFPSAPAPL